MKAIIRIVGLICLCIALISLGKPMRAQGWGGWGGGGFDRGDEQQRPAPGGYGQGPGGYGQTPGGGYGQQGYGSQQRYNPPPPQQGGYQSGGYGNQQNPYQPSYGANANPRCRELEAQLTGGYSQSLTSQDQLPRLDQDIRQADLNYRKAQSDAERSDCYEDMFFFGRSLKRTPRCLDLDRQAQTAKARLAQLNAQREAITRGSTQRLRRDDIVAELARNRCGDSYAREYEQQRDRNNSIFSLFSNEEEDDPNRGQTPFQNPYATPAYATKCVRLCDGFYFPISYATTEAHFREDQAKCQSLCAAPAELYVHRNDQDVDTMTTIDGQPYTQMPNAFRNRKVFIRGCSCNANEFSREEIAKSEEALRTGKRADTGGKQQSASADTPQKLPQSSPAR